MSDWIRKKAEQLRAKQEKLKQSQKIILNANFWHLLIEQIKSDVIEINSECQDILTRPLECSEAENSVQIATGSYPAVNIYVRNKGEQIELETAIQRTSDVKFKRQKELLDVRTDGNVTYLSLRDDIFIIPKQASEFILSRILDVIEKNIEG